MSWGKVVLVKGWSEELVGRLSGFKWVVLRCVGLGRWAGVGGRANACVRDKCVYCGSGVYVYLGKIVV